MYTFSLWQLLNRRSAAHNTIHACYEHAVKLYIHVVLKARKMSVS